MHSPYPKENDKTEQCETELPKKLLIIIAQGLDG
jgi:hypothetical protein